MLIAAIKKNTEMMRFLNLYRESYNGDIRFIVDRKGSQGLLNWGKIGPLRPLKVDIGMRFQHLLNIILVMKCQPFNRDKIHYFYIRLTCCICDKK